MGTHEREITEPVDLCLPDGRLNPDAVGWTRRPLHRSNLRGWGRVKRWEYWGIVTPRHIIGLVASSLDYAGVHGVWVLDRETGEESARDAVVPFARGAVFPDRSGAGEASVRGGEWRSVSGRGRRGRGCAPWRPVWSILTWKFRCRTGTSRSVW